MKGWTESWKEGTGCGHGVRPVRFATNLRRCGPNRPDSSGPRKCVARCNVVWPRKWGNASGQLGSSRGHIAAVQFATWGGRCFFGVRDARGPGSVLRHAFGEYIQCRSGPCLEWVATKVRQRVRPMGFGNGPNFRSVGAVTVAARCVLFSLLGWSVVKPFPPIPPTGDRLAPGRRTPSAWGLTNPDTKTWNAWKCTVRTSNAEWNMNSNSDFFFFVCVGGLLLQRAQQNFEMSTKLKKTRPRKSSVPRSPRLCCSWYFDRSTEDTQNCQTD